MIHGASSHLPPCQRSTGRVGVVMVAIWFMGSADIPHLRLAGETVDTFMIALPMISGICGTTALPSPLRRSTRRGTPSATRPTLGSGSHPCRLLVKPAYKALEIAPSPNDLPDFDCSISSHRKRSACAKSAYSPSAV